MKPLTSTGPPIMDTADTLTVVLSKGTTALYFNQGLTPVRFSAQRQHFFGLSEALCVSRLVVSGEKSAEDLLRSGRVEAPPHFSTI